MSLKSRLLIYVNLFFLIAIFIGLAAIILSAKNNVRQEILSTQSLAFFAIENGIKKNAEIYFSQEKKASLGLSKLNELRHLNIKFFNTNDQLIEQTSSGLSILTSPPNWFISILEKFSTILPGQKINIKLKDKEIGYISINPEPMYEYSEIWQQLKSSFWIILLLFGLVNIMILIVFYHTLKPINSIIKGFKKLEAENYKAKIGKINILEFDIIGQNFNRMVRKVKEDNIKIHKLSQDLINIQEQEKKELARNLHDELGQSLTAIQAEAASIKKNKNEVSRIQALNSIINISKNMMLSTRVLIKKLSLGILDEMGIEIAITDLVDNWSKRYPSKSSHYFYDKNLNGLIPPSFDGRIYRIVQEALTNITKHSNPKNITISFQLKKNKKEFVINIVNDGIKIKRTKVDGVGLLGMTERVNQMKGLIKFKQKENFEINIVLRTLK